MADQLDWPPHSVDAFHRGAFHLVQPTQAGHRAGTDAMMLAAAVPTGFDGRVVDLGSGAGAAGLAVLARCSGASVLLVERAPEMVEWAQRTLALPHNAAFAPRAEILQADVALAGDRRRAAGLLDNSADFVIFNPPFNLAPDRSSPDELRRQAHVLTPDLFLHWVRTAAALLRPKGQVAVIARPQSLPEILAAFSTRFGRVEIVPVHSRPDAAAIRVVIRGELGSRAALSLLPPLVMHGADGHGFSARAEAVTNGRASLFGD